MQRNYNISNLGEINNNQNYNIYFQLLGQSELQ